MFNSTVFIISKRKELSIKYKRLIEGLKQEVFVINSAGEVFEQIQKQEPELIVVSDTICDNFNQFIKQIRVLTYNFRPVIVAISKSSELNDKLAVLNSGADDYLDEAVDKSEFQARIKAHLRRNTENSINVITNYVGKDFTIKALKRTLNSGKKMSAALIEITGINYYRDIYGEIAYEKVLQTLGAMINSTLGEKDFIGHFSQKEFILIAPTHKIETLTAFLTFAFDNILDRFYSEFDFKNKFMKYFSDERIENKIPLMKLSIGVINTDEAKFENYKMALNSLVSIVKLCKNSPNSCYIIDRPKIKGEVKTSGPKDRILIIEEDEALSYLLLTTCELKGLKGQILTNINNFAQVYEEFSPNVAIIDYSSKAIGGLDGLQICRSIKEKNDNIKVIFSSSKHKKNEILSVGADLYLPKPYDIKVLFSWVKKFLA